MARHISDSVQREEVEKWYLAAQKEINEALVSALEKKDGEELSLLKSTHEQNLLKLQRSVKQQQIDDAQAQLAALQSQQQNVQNKIDYYNGLIQGGLSTWETLEAVFKHTATGLLAAEALLRIQSGIAFLIMQVGSPWAMKLVSCNQRPVKTHSGK